MNIKFMCSLISCLLFMVSTIDSQLRIAKIPKYLRGWGLNQPLCGLTDVLDLIETNWDPDCYHNKCCLNPYEDEVYIKNRGGNGPQMRIYGGHRIDNTESPWTVHILPMKWHRQQWRTCTGVLITLEWVMTAAHCFEDWKNEGWFDNEVIVTAGSNITRAYTYGLEERTNSVNKWYSHHKYLNPGYGKSKTITKKRLEIIKALHDIALFKVSKPFTRRVEKQKYRINTICLPQQMSIYEIDRLFNRPQNAKVYGFSNLLPNKRQIRGINDVFRKMHGLLRTGTVELNIYSQCYPYGVLCSLSLGNEPRGCKGDSGGPLVQHFNNSIDVIQQKSILLGILLGGYGEEGYDCGPQRNETVYLAVPMFIDWIFDILSKH